MADTTKKIIRGIVNSRGFTITSAITQWDYGWQFIPEIEDLPSTYRLDFSNEENHGTALPIYCGSEGAEVPTELIDTGKDVWVWYVAIGDGYGITEYKWRIPNKCKPKTEEDEPTPSQQSSIDQAISVVNEAVETVEQSASDASASAQSAQDYAEQAESARDTAQGYASNAQLSATQASNSAMSANQSASASAQSASQSAQIKADVEDMVDDAQGYAESASQFASASAQSASDAQGYAQSASASATSAQGYASNAQTSANTASSKAQDASGYAQTASEKASEASQSASQAQTYKTDAESAKTASQTAQGVAESARDSAQGYAEDAQGYAEDAQASAESISASATQIAQNTADIASLEEDRYKPYVTDSASGSIASFPDGADDIPLKSLVVDIDPVQDTSSGDPSPENICPISGWTGCNINATNDNLICDSLPSDYFVCGALQTDDTTISNGATYRAYCVYVGKNAKIGYRKEVNPSTALNLGLAFADVYLTSRTGSVIYDALNMANRSSKTLNSGEHPYLVIVVLNSNINNKTYNARKAYVFLNNNGRSVSFSPQRNIDKYAIDWSSEAGTVYGGRLDVLTGVLTVYPYYASYNGETLTGEWVSDRDVYAEGTTPTIGAQVVDMSGTGTEVQLEANEIASLLGANNIWADTTGDCSVEYRADTRLYIKRLTDSDTDMIADANITSGQYFMVGNDLYRATVNIASGAQVIEGTNATKVSLSEALNQIKEA